MKKTFLMRCARWLSSKEAGFVFACIGVITQAFHTYYICILLTSLEGWQKEVQAIFMALFMTGALLYFTLKSSDANTATAKKYRRMVTTFASIDAFINMAYYTNHLLIVTWPNAMWFEFAISMPISWLLPIILKTYGGEVNPNEIEHELEHESVLEPIPEPEPASAKHDEPAESETITRIIKIAEPKPSAPITTDIVTGPHIVTTYSEQNNSIEELMDSLTNASVTEPVTSEPLDEPEVVIEHEQIFNSIPGIMEREGNVIDGPIEKSNFGKLQTNGVIPKQVHKIEDVPPLPKEVNQLFDKLKQ